MENDVVGGPEQAVFQPFGMCDQDNIACYTELMNEMWLVENVLNQNRIHKII